MLPVPTVPVLHPREDGLAVVPGDHFPLRDPHPVLAEDRLVLLGRVAQLVELDVTERVGGGAVRAPFRVVEAAAVGLPREAMTSSRPICLGDGVLAVLAGGDVDDVDVAVLGARVSERDRDALSVG